MIRLGNRLLVLVLGVVLLAGGLLIIIEGVWNWTNSGFVWIPGSEWLHSFETTAWSDRHVVLWSLVAVVVGVLLLVLELRPQRPRVLKLDVESPGEWLVLRRSTEGHLQRRLEAKVPTKPIKTRLKPRPRGWTLKLKANAAASTRPELEAAGRAELAAMHAPSTSRVQVRTLGPKSQS
jgi:hypothetical protein